MSNDFIQFIVDNHPILTGYRAVRIDVPCFTCVQESYYFSKTERLIIKELLDYEVKEKICYNFFIHYISKAVSFVFVLDDKKYIFSAITDDLKNLYNEKNFIFENFQEEDLFLFGNIFVLRIFFNKYYNHRKKEEAIQSFLQEVLKKKDKIKEILKKEIKFSEKLNELEELWRYK